MTVYYLSAAGLNATQIAPDPFTMPLQWVKLFPGDTDPHHWTVQTFPATLLDKNGNSVTDGSVADQGNSLVYFARGSQPAPTAVGSPNVASLTYDLAVPVSSSVELDPSFDWWVAYPVHGVAPFNNSWVLKANQMVTIVVSRAVGSIYLGENGSPSAPFGGAVLGRAVSGQTIPSGAVTVIELTTSQIGSGNPLYQIGGVSLGTGIQLQATVENAGIYSIEARIGYQANSTGTRFAGFNFNTNYLLTPSTDMTFSWTGAVAANIAAGQLPPITWEGYLPAYTNVSLVTLQDSGVGLSIYPTATTISIRQIG